MKISFLFADIDECGGHHRSKRSYWWFNVFSKIRVYKSTGTIIFVMLPHSNHNSNGK